MQEFCERNSGMTENKIAAWFSGWEALDLAIQEQVWRLFGTTTFWSENEGGKRIMCGCERISFLFSEMTPGIPKKTL